MYYTTTFDLSLIFFLLRNYRDILIFRCKQQSEAQQTLIKFPNTARQKLGRGAEENREKWTHVIRFRSRICTCASVLHNKENNTEL